MECQTSSIPQNHAPALKKPCPLFKSYICTNCPGSSPAAVYRTHRNMNTCFWDAPVAANVPINVVFLRCHVRTPHRGDRDTSTPILYGRLEGLPEHRYLWPKCSTGESVPGYGTPNFEHTSKIMPLYPRPSKTQLFVQIEYTSKTVLGPLQQVYVGCVKIWTRVSEMHPLPQTYWFSPLGMLCMGHCPVPPQVCPEMRSLLCSYISSKCKWRKTNFYHIRFHSIGTPNFVLKTFKNSVDFGEAATPPQGEISKNEPPPLQDACSSLVNICEREILIGVFIFGVARPPFAPKIGKKIVTRPPAPPRKFKNTTLKT